MKITRVETIHVRADLSRPTGPASVLNRARQSLFVKLTTDAGLVGWGETYALAGVRSAIQDSLAPLLIGQDPLEVRQLWQRMWNATFENGFAVGGVDIALHDLWGKALGVPIHQLYGGALRTRVPVYASGLCYVEGVDPADAWVDEAVGLSERGFRAIKMRLGRYAPDHELPVVEQVRAALPSATRLMVDAWGSYTFQTAVAVGRELGRLGVYWFEEPLPQAGYVGYPELADRLRIALAGGETLRSRQEFQSLFARRAVDVVQPDACICGGLTELLFIAELARLHGIQCMPHTWNGALMAAATLQVLAVLPDPSRMPGVETPMLEWDTTENPFMDTLREPFSLRDGCFDVPSGPGLGVEVDEERLQQYAV